MSADARPATVTEPWDVGAPAAIPVGSFGRYRIERALGAGGMGVVVAAYDPELGRQVAIKFLRRADAAAEARLLDEARAMARLTHPNVVAVHEVVRLGDRAGIVMERIDGRDLARWLAEAPRRWDAIVEVYRQAGRGLAAAHRAGLVHRDFKPTNALIDADGVVRVTDFGLACTIDEVAADRAGTPAYMAPEQRRGDPVDARTDQWALGHALAEALAGPHRLGRPAPAAIDRALARACADDPDARFASLDELLAALAPRRSRRGALTLALAGGAVLTGGALALTFGLGWGRDRPPSCDAVAAAELAPIWGPPRQLALTTGMVGRGPATAATWPGTSAAVTAQATAWTVARATACRADRDAAIAPALTDLRLGCLTRRRVELAALLDALGRPTPDAVTLAQGLALTLTDPALCLDVAALARRDPLPTEPATRIAVAAIRARLAAAQTAAELGDLAPARRQLAGLLGEARALAWPPLVAEVMIAAGRAANAERDHAAAERLLDEGVLIAEAAGHDLATARGLIELVDVRGHGLVRPDDGLALVPRARAVLTRLGGAPELAATLDTHRGRILIDQARYAEALTVFEAVLAARRAAGPRHPGVASSLIDVGDALVKLGRPTDALPRYREAEALRAALFGPTHLTTVRARFSIGNGLLELGDYAAAAAAYREAIAAYQAIYGDRHPLMVTPLNNLGLTYRLAGRPADALPVLERGLAMARDLGTDPIGIARLAHNLGATLRDLGRPGAARPHLEAAAAGYRAALGPTHPSAVGPVLALVELDLASGARAAAQARLDEAVAAATAAGGAEHPVVRELAEARAKLSRR